MSLDKASVAKIARLARLKMDAEALEPMAAELNKILDFVGQLNELDTSDVPPLTSVVAVKLPQRDDVVTDGGDAAAILRNAPSTEAGFFIVPRVVE